MKKQHVNGIATALALCSFCTAAQACNTEPYIGTVCVFAFDWCPRGYVNADGRSMSIRENTALFGLLGFSYGGDGSTVFQIPDLRGRFAIGTGAGPGLNPIAITQKVGQSSLTLTAAQAPVPAHSHPAVFAPTTGPMQVALPATPGTLDVKAALPVNQGLGTATGKTVAPASGDGYLAGMSGTTGVDDITFTGPYSTNVPGPGSPTLPATVKVSGNAGTAASSITVQTVTGGAVTVNSNTPVPATLPVSTQSPAIGMSVCIAVTGLYPNRP